MSESLSPLPMHCVDTEQPDLLGRRCEDCPLTRCQALAAGQLLVEQQATIADLAELNHEFEEANAALLDRLFNLRLDSLVETAFTPEGLKDYLTHDKAIRDELAHMEWGVVRLDGRFVNYINRYGNLVGDDFLQRGGEEITAITDGLVRTHHRRRCDDGRAPDRRQMQRRAGHSLGQEDVICRQGGDEFALLIRNVTPQQLAIVMARVQSKLTVPYALERYANGQVPFIASVGSAHATDRRPEVNAALSAQDPWHAFRIINGLADEGQRTIKSQQYREMWDLTQRAIPPADVKATIAQPDDRVVAERFLTHLCPEFQQDPIAFLTGSN